MENKMFDEDLFHFYSQLIEDELEIGILKDMLLNIQDEEIIDKYIHLLREEIDDQN